MVKKFLHFISMVGDETPKCYTAGVLYSKDADLLLILFDFDKEILKKSCMSTKADEIAFSYSN